MIDTIKSVSDIDPLFTETTDGSVCTRTWEDDPQLSHGEVVTLGNTICRVVNKTTHSTKAGIYLTTYQFSPIDQHAEIDPHTGKLFLNMAIPAGGHNLYIDPNAPTDNWEGILAGDAED